MSGPPQLASPFVTLLQAKAAKGVTFEQIGKAIGKDEVWVAALMYGQAKATSEELAKLTSFLDIQTASLETQIGDGWYPDRGI
ncbi:hypothetical protein M422DRAFT_784963, partial [Sphaerobolus stellatus SS14]